MTESATLGDRISFAPAAFDPDAAQLLREAFGARFHGLGKDEQALVAGAAACSPYLRRLMMRDPDFVAEVLRAPSAVMLERACADATRAADAESSDEQLAILRRAKNRAALLIALADIAGYWDVMQSAEAVSAFADAAISAAIRAGCRKAGHDADASGIAVLAMGKLGACELNYSSDIDLIVLYDPTAMGALGKTEAQAAAVKAAREMVALLQTQTPDGYVFRTDLRLRPDPGVSALAISVQAAETYYEVYGQNWERMAFVKARAAAGDIGVGEAFLSSLRPFVWRKFLDFAAIEDVKAVKKQIHSAKGGATIEFEGHNIKLGRGGIREIEFYAQTQQLILGGKNQNLRVRGTLDALSALNAHGHVSDDVHRELAGAYRYLRHVEHRLQMINDEQTHRIPKAPQDIERLAAFLGEANIEAFADRLIPVLRGVERRYDGLFRSDADEAASVGPMVFTGVESDPATIETLKTLGFKRPEDVSETIRRWHAGGLRATRTERARIILTKLMSPLLEALSKAGNPDDAFFAFADFLSRLPAGVQVFSLLANNIVLFDRLIEIMTVSPFIGRELSKRVNFIERLVEESLAAPPPAPETYAESLKDTLAAARDYEDALNMTRRWAGEARFLIAAQLAVGLRPAADAAAHFSAIADACIMAMCEAAQSEMRRQHGDIDGALAIAGLGRLGAREMTATSDIDLIFIYDAPADALSTGARPLSPTDYYTRLVRRIVTALSAATPEGALYEVDMQLRPSGGAGPAAVSLSAFQRYYAEEAWTWELMALSKARVICGGASLTGAVESEIETIFRRPREREKLKADVGDMRRRLLEAKPGAGPWNVKHVRGGHTDIAFVCQYLALEHGARWGRPPQPNVGAIAWFAEKGALSREDAENLLEAQRLYDGVLQTARAATGGVFAPEGAGAALTARMASLCERQSIKEAEQALTRRQEQVASIYCRVIGPYSDREQNVHDGDS